MRVYLDEGRNPANWLNSLLFSLDEKHKKGKKKGMERDKERRWYIEISWDFCVIGLDRDIESI